MISSALWIMPSMWLGFDVHKTTPDQPWAVLWCTVPLHRAPPLWYILVGCLLFTHRWSLIVVGRSFTDESDSSHFSCTLGSRLSWDLGFLFFLFSEKTFLWGRRGGGGGYVDPSPLPHAHD